MAIGKGDDVGVGVVMVALGLLTVVSGLDNREVELLLPIGIALILVGVFGIRQSLNKD